MSAEPAGATVAVIAARADISVPAAWQAPLAHEKNGTAARVKGSRPGIADTWTPAVPPAPAAETPGAGSTPDDGQAAAQPAVGQSAPVPADGTAGDQQEEAGPEPGPDPGRARRGRRERRGHRPGRRRGRKAFAAGNLEVAPAALETARDLAAQGRRVIKAAASGRRAPATRPGALRDLVEEHLWQVPRHRLHSAPGRQGADPVGWRGRQPLDKLVSFGTAQMVTDKPRTYQLASAAPAPDAADDPCTSAEATASAA